MAIFVALIFQVLFVLFAMCLNVALIVHDKINLQNAVDLAAYYGAERQAEILNAMAHVNYQIRQSYKLMAWRYRVLGTTGLEITPHPSGFLPTDTSNNESEWAGGGISHPSRYPKLCVNFRPTWTGSPAEENVCKDTNLVVPEIPQIHVIAGFVPINFVISQFSTQLRAQFDSSCVDQGVWDWWYVKAIKASFRQDQANRRDVFNALAADLSRSSADIIDLDGNNIQNGVFATMKKNLTWSNSQQVPAIEYFNSMQNIPRQQWVKEIYVNPTFFWLDFATQGSAGCDATTKNFQQVPFNIGQQAWGYIQNNLDGARLQADQEQEPEGDVSMRLSIGYEKNPWAMVYTGVRAQVQTRNLFHPFGSPITLTARAFAKPFGGRMGPWHGSLWKPGAPMSEGPQIDVRGQPRTKANGLLDSPDNPNRFPNYSRFPGDQLGLASRLAQAGSTSLRANFQGDLSHFFDIYSSIMPGRVNDPLSWNRTSNTGDNNERKYEIAAIAPDLFDISYYSIDANFWGNYGQKINNNRAALGIPDTVVIRPDLGFRGGVPALANFGVQNQMNLATGAGVQNPRAFYYVRQIANLLTSWLPGPFANNYVPAEGSTDIPNGDLNVPFGVCTQPDYSLSTNGNAAQNMPPNPGSCIIGGRTGYSVKLVSRNYLMSGSMRAGGPSSGAGPIQNPPTF